MNRDEFNSLERYELKYQIPFELVPQVRDFLRPWCELDAHSQDSADNAYWVTSLYLDSPRFTFFNWKELGMEDRFNMRIRTYGENPSQAGPRFFEVKHKHQDVILKTRGTLQDGHPERLWTDLSGTLARVQGMERRNLERFWQLTETYNANPCVLTQYRRIAWFGVHEDYARVTIDWAMRWRAESGFDFSVDPMQMRPSDGPAYFRPGTNAVLELKCPRDQVPWWMLDMIRALDLRRSTFSKFGNAVSELLCVPKANPRPRHPYANPVLA